MYFKSLWFVFKWCAI